MRLLLLLLLCLPVLPAADTSPAAAPDDPVARALSRLYNFDFAGAHRLLDEHIRQDPAHAVAHSVKAACYLFAELDRLGILEMEFFADDSKVTDKKKLKPDPALRQGLMDAAEAAKRHANARLAQDPHDRDAMFALCMVHGVLTDYAMLVERRYFRSFSFSRQAQAYAHKLLTLNPPEYDAYLTLGTVEYVVGSMNFFFRLFVRFDKIQGSKEKGIQNLEKVVKAGRYSGPFARILLSVIHLRENRVPQAQALLAGLVRDFPENPLLRKELHRANEKLARLNGGGR